MSGSGRRSGGGRTTTVRVLVAVAVVLLLGTTIGVIATGSDDDAPTATTAPAALDEGGEELVELLRGRADHTYHARYEGFSGAERAPVTLETWPQPPLVRQDAEVDVDGQLARTSTLVLADDTIRCTAIGDSTPYACRSGGADGLGDADPTSAIIERLNGASVTARDSVVDERPVRCFDLTTQGATSEMCVDEDGIPVLIRGGDSELTRVDLDEDIPEGTFEPPAPVEG
jgi:hypothetical protein